MQLNICKQNRIKQKRLLGPFQSFGSILPKFGSFTVICRACHDRCKLSSSDAAKIACHRWTMTINHWKSIGNHKSRLLFHSKSGPLVGLEANLLRLLFLEIPRSPNGRPPCDTFKQHCFQSPLKFEENISWWFILALPNLCIYVIYSVLQAVSTLNIL